ncbi:hypothetical protein FisN_8Lh217 [Fistulifera solaris]|uniref:RRM domain-containing protein n=1 Tax=Fistulifera solaris TaxID=1519565 RepID=A0A1Z5JNR3_FISSO|nr:hypothetical protein FisN_8Lh217 [Fistulifera solaris]|eukprot:GAX15482.1 hypothetical protein FisN_8Lh217 [Fistulifera solaris]
MIQRRTILLAVVAGTPADSPTLSRIIDEGYLSAVKMWLDDVLQHSVGSVDFLLHLLTCIVNLPVTKNAVKESGMGKAIGTIEKHPMCKGSPNEAAISKRVQDIKEAWNASVKARKAIESTSEVSITSNKRANEEINDSQLSSKKPKVSSTTKKSSSFSTLLKKVSGPPKDDSAGDKGDEEDEKKPVKKSTKRVKWSDHFGGELTVSKVVEGGEVVQFDNDTSVSWSDRKMRDRLREKELLATARKAKLMDDDEDNFNLDSRVASTMVPTTAWRFPNLLPERPDVAPANLVSQEITTQNLRMQTVLAAMYPSESDVPPRPSPLTEVEQALDMTSQSSAIVQEIPFFIPEPVAPAPEPAPAPAYQPLSVPAFDPNQGYQSFVAAQTTGATPEFVQALGLPLFLVGQNVQALQTLASSPGLLANFVDASGAYDQARLMGLVQTLSVTNGSQPTPTLSYGTTSAMYGTPAPVAQYGQPQSYASQPRGAPRGSSEGNLHVSGYGPSTTEAEIIELFSPYVQVDQVVMKGTFSFVNTSDPLNAQRAKEALAGTLLGGMPIRINPAQRKNTTAYGSSTVAPGGSFSSAPSNGVYGQGAVASVPAIHVNNPVSDPGSIGQTNVDLARDDRGNPATKNLFVAGYGPNTQEQEIRDIFGQYVHVIGVVSKGSFTFVNTTDREAAVRARQALSGTMLNGGVLRINFAKETGRLGTSFDLTYGKAGGPNAQVQMNSNAGQSYYGRGY